MGWRRTQIVLWLQAPALGAPSLCLRLQDSRKRVTAQSCTYMSSLLHPTQACNSRVGCAGRGSMRRRTQIVLWLQAPALGAPSLCLHLQDS